MNVTSLSTGSDSRPCWNVAVEMSEPLWRKTATRKSVPAPVTPLNRFAAMGALMSALTMPVAMPATTTYATVTSRRTNSRIREADDGRDGEQSDDHRQTLEQQVVRAREHVQPLGSVEPVVRVPGHQEHRVRPRRHRP